MEIAVCEAGLACVREPAATAEVAMLDVVAVIAMALLFAVSAAYVTGCDGLKGAKR